MDNHKWNAVKELFNRALDIEKGERVKWLKDTCADDQELFIEVKKLLDARDVSSPVDKPLDKLPDTIFSPEPDEDDTNRKVGNYRLLEVIGYGGMGVVYRAERVDGEFEQHVALKFLRFGMASKKLIRRFKKERQILAKLQHPNIARLYDGGVMKDGTPWFSMEYIEGLPVTEFAEKNDLSIEDRLNLFRKICAAVQYAHQNLVIHRDLKPSNIMITGEGEPVLLDFGLARLEDEKSIREQDITRSSQNWMTLEYASPEQIRGKKLTTATDVYQLGLVLHELLTGHRPYSVKGATPSEAEKIICNTQPSKPSTSIKSLKEAQVPFSPAELYRILKGDLDTIILKALEKDPEMRYSSVERMSDDINSHLKNKPILARKPTFRYKALKYIKRHGKTLAVAALLLFGLFILNAFYTNQLAGERDIANREAERAEAVKDFMVNMVSEANPSQSPGEPLTVRDLLDHHTNDITDKFPNDPDIAFELLRTIGNAQNQLGDRSGARESLEKAYELMKTENITLEPQHLASFKLTLSSTYIGASERKIDLLNRAKILVENNPEAPLLRAGITRSLAYTLYSQGDYEESVELLRSTFESACSDFGLERNPSWCLASLFDGYHFMTRAGYPDEAFQLAEKHYQLTMEFFPEKGHPERALTGQLYGNALSDHNRPNEAIALLNETIEEFDDFGETYRRRILGLTTILGLAESMKGNDSRAVILWENILEEVKDISTDAFNRSVQLNLMVDRLVNLERYDDALESINRYLPNEEDLTHIGKWGHRYNEIRLEMLRARVSGIPHNRWLNYVEDFRENYEIFLPNVLVYALYDAVNRQDEESAAYWLEQIESTDDYDPEDDFEGLVSLSRYWLAHNNTYRADDFLKNAELLLSSREESKGPRLARLYALKAEKYCQSEEAVIGLEALEQAELLWEEANGHETGIQTLRNYAESCF